MSLNICFVNPLDHLLAHNITAQFVYWLKHKTIAEQYIKQLRHDLLIDTLTVTHSHYKNIHPKNEQTQNLRKNLANEWLYFMGTRIYTSIQQSKKPSR